MTRRIQPRALSYRPERPPVGHLAGAVDLAGEVWSELANANHWTTDEVERRLQQVGRNYGPLLLAEAYWANDLTDSAAVTACVGPSCSMAEFPERSLDPDEWRQLFDAAGYTVTGEDGLAVRAVLPREPVVLWRGATQAGRLGWSWSSDRHVAERFANEMVRGRDAGSMLDSGSGAGAAAGLHPRSGRVVVRRRYPRLTCRQNGMSRDMRPTSGISSARVGQYAPRDLGRGSRGLE